MMIKQKIVRGVPGRGVNIGHHQSRLVTSCGKELPAKGAWHLELSQTKHIYLERIDNVLRLAFKEFKFNEKVEAMESTGFHVKLDQQQTADLIFVLPDIVHATRRSEMRKVSFFTTSIFLYIYIYSICPF